MTPSKVRAVLSAQRGGVAVRLQTKPGLDERRLTRAANTLLAASLVILGRDEYPFYSEAYLRNRDARDHGRQEVPNATD